MASLQVSCAAIWQLSEKSWPSTFASSLSTPPPPLSVLSVCSPILDVAGFWCIQPLPPVLAVFACLSVSYDHCVQARAELNVGWPAWMPALSNRNAGHPASQPKLSYYVCHVVPFCLAALFIPSCVPSRQQSVYRKALNHIADPPYDQPCTLAHLANEEPHSGPATRSQF